MGEHATESGLTAQPAFAAGALDPTAIASARWFAGKGRAITCVTCHDSVPVPGADGASLLLADVDFADGGVERYLVPSARNGGALDTVPDHPLWPALAEVVRNGARLEGRAGVVEAHAAADGPRPGSGARRLTSDQSNTSVVLGEQLVVKCYRRLEPGTHPEPELLAALAAAGCRVAPAYAGSVTYSDGDGRTASLAVLYGYVPGEPVGWEPMISALATGLRSHDAEALLVEAGALGAATAELHVALADALGHAPGTVDDATRAERAASDQLDEALRTLTPDDPLHRLAPRLGEQLAGLRHLRGSPLTRVHGDLHVAQFVRSGSGHVAVDFEGEPGRPLADRRRRTSPLRDLACLLLSFDHVAAAAAKRHGSASQALPAARTWSAEARARALDRYSAGIAGSALVVDASLLRALEIEKECRELLYAATVLPEWLYAPRATLPHLLREP